MSSTHIQRKVLSEGNQTLGIRSLDSVTSFLNIKHVDISNAHKNLCILQHYLK